MLYINIIYYFYFLNLSHNYILYFVQHYYLYNLLVCKKLNIFIFLLF